jgi:hypothetical protein
MNEQSRVGYSHQPSRTTTQGSQHFNDVSSRERAWLKYQRWRFQHGLLTEFPDVPGQAQLAGPDFDRQPDPVRQPARRFGWLR